jgi:hypothetical protein
MSLEFWRDIAVVLLSLQLLIALLIPLVAGFFMVKGMGWVHRKTHPILTRAREWSGLIREQTDRRATQVISPVIGINRRAAQARGILAHLWPPRQRS